MFVLSNFMFVYFRYLRERGVSPGRADGLIRTQSIPCNRGRVARDIPPFPMSNAARFNK
jgi:hypothetical protein